MGKRKRCTGENEAPFLMDALPCPSAKDDPVLKKTVGSAPSLRHSSRYGLVYSRRKPTNKSTISTSSSSVVKQDEKLSSLKLDCQNNSLSRLHTENLEKEACRSERKKTSFLPPKIVYSNPAKMPCGLCRNQLKRKPFILENSMALDDLSVVAVLVCGHVYHADCLESKTSVEDQSNPLCPLCVEKHYP